MAFLFDGYSTVGYKREDNEDFVLAKALDKNNNVVLAIVADGSGSMPSKLQPAQIACRYIDRFITNAYNVDDGSLLLSNPSFFLKQSVLQVNSVLGAFKTANEEIYSGFYCALTCVLFYTNSQNENRMAFAHSGNTRLYLIRSGNDGNAQIRQITKDHTEAQLLVDDGKLAPDQYYFHESRNKLICPLGAWENPRVDSFDGKIRSDCIFLMSTDGIHYAIRPEPIAQLVLENNSLHDACVTLCETASNLQYNDDYCALLCRIV